MNDQEIKDRFEELEAGRILGDLDAEEIREWEKLSEDPRCQSDLSLELTAASLEAEYLGGDDSELPEDLVKKLHGDMADFISPQETEEESDAGKVSWLTVLTTSKAGWAIAALFAILLVAQSVTQKGAVQQPSGQNEGPTVLSSKESRDLLIAKAGDLIQSDFGGTESYRGMSGNVVWSDELQEGYMVLTGLPVNDPKANQYQLWIVDPNRDEKPVDGGVFDISGDEGAMIIPIRNPLMVNNPKAFVITLEQPGGVVVSKQEVVVALADTSSS